jgi:hypothetical protein
MCLQTCNIGGLLLWKFYAIKFADLIGAINCSINEAVAEWFCRRAISPGVFPIIFLAFGSALESMRALITSSGAPFRAATCSALLLDCYSVVYLLC